MFQNLTDRLQGALKRLRGQSVISESNIADAMQDIREALLEADVNIEVAESFVSEVRKDCLGEQVLRSVTPGQMAIKIVFDRLTEFMGGGEAELIDGAHPNIIIMCGLHGSGKTTSSAKLANFLKAKKSKKVLLAACDVYRPAAIDQLQILGNEIGVPVYAERENKDVPQIALRALEQAKCTNADYLIIDTAGRLQINEAMVQELVQVKKVTDAKELLLVADAALGQQAVSVAKHFNDALQLTGVILTKLDGDARGGAALSIRKITNCPIKFAGLGERIDELDVFYPDRMASRILGMGDVVSLVEKAAEKFDKEEAEKLEEKFRKNSFDFNDFLTQLRQMSKLGGLDSILKLLPGGDKFADLPGFDSKKFKYMEAIICSMNKKERENPDLIDMPRRKRIAKGCGRPVEEVSQLIKQFMTMKRMMKNTGMLGRLLGGNQPSGGIPGMLGMGGASMGGGFRMHGSNYTPPKKKRKKK